MVPGSHVIVSISISFPIPFLRKWYLGLMSSFPFPFHFLFRFLGNGTWVPCHRFHFHFISYSVSWEMVPGSHVIVIVSISFPIPFLGKWYPGLMSSFPFPFHFLFRFLGNGTRVSCHRFHFHFISYSVSWEMVPGSHVIVSISLSFPIPFLGKWYLGPMSSFPFPFHFLFRFLGNGTRVSCHRFHFHFISYSVSSEMVPGSHVIVSISISFPIPFLGKLYLGLMSSFPFYFLFRFLGNGTWVSCPRFHFISNSVSWEMVPLSHVIVSISISFPIPILGKWYLGLVSSFPFPFHFQFRFLGNGTFVLCHRFHFHFIPYFVSWEMVHLSHVIVSISFPIPFLGNWHLAFMSSFPFPFHFPFRFLGNGTWVSCPRFHFHFISYSVSWEMVPLSHVIVSISISFPIPFLGKLHLAFMSLFPFPFHFLFRFLGNGTWVSCHRFHFYFISYSDSWEMVPGSRVLVSFSVSFPIPFLGKWYICLMSSFPFPFHSLFRLLENGTSASCSRFHFNFIPFLGKLHLAFMSLFPFPFHFLFRFFGN